MRWIFLSLILINGAVFFWQWQQREAVAAQRPVPKAMPSRAEAMPGVEKLVLLSELEEEALAVLLQQKQERLRMAEAEVLAEAEQPLCTLVGPYAKLLKAEYLVEHMAALEIKAEVQEVEIPGDVGYWVYLAPEVSKKEALRRLHELQAKGVDSYVIPRGELANGISFGMFSQQELANKRQSDMVAQGYATGIKEITRSHKENWVIFAPEEALKVGEEVWQKVLDEGPGMERRQNFCPSVASVENFQ